MNSQTDCSSVSPIHNVLKICIQIVFSVGPRSITPKNFLESSVLVTYSHAEAVSQQINVCVQCALFGPVVFGGFSWVRIVRLSVCGCLRIHFELIVRVYMVVRAFHTTVPTWSRLFTVKRSLRPPVWVLFVDVFHV